MKKLPRILVAVTLIFGVSLVACEKSSTGTGAKTPVEGGTLVVGATIIDAQLASKNPFFPNNTSVDLINFMYEPLMFFNLIAGTLEPMIATGYEWSDNNMTVTFTIRDGIKWHDGSPLGAEDVVFTYNVLKDFPITDRFSLWKRLNSVTADGNEVVFKFSEAFPSFPFYTNEIRIVPKHIWEAVPSIVDFLDTTPVGSGPFVWSSYTVGTDVQLKANKDYWIGSPKVDNFIIRLYNNASNLTLGLLREDIHAALGGTIAMPSVPEFLSRPNAKIQRAPGLGNWVVAMNLENEMLSDVNVRRAMRMAINTGDLISRGEYDMVYPTSYGFLPAVFSDLMSEKAKEPHVYDPAMAVKLLEDSGYTKGSDGIFQKGGKRLSFTYHNASGAPAQQMEAGMIQQWLLNIGIEVIPRLATWPELTSLLQNGGFDLLQNAIGPPPDPFATLNTTFHSSMTAPIGQNATGMNYFRYRNSKVDVLLDEVANVVDPSVQKQLFGQIQDILIDDVPYLPMYNTGPRVPYYDGTRYSGWVGDAPALSNRAVINIYEVR